MPLAPYPQYSTYPPRKSRTGLVIGLVIGAVVVVIGIGAGGYALAQPDGRPATAATGPAQPAAAPATPSATPSTVASPKDHSGDLRRFLLPAPESSDPWSKPVSKDGRLTLRQVASGYQDTTSATDYLHGLAFQAGAVRTWVEADGTSVEIDLYRFGTDNGAYQFFTDEVGNDVDNMPKGTTITMIDRISGGKGEVVAFAKKDKYGDQMSHGMALKADVVTEVWVFQSPPQSVAFTEGVTYQQWSRL